MAYLALSTAFPAGAMCESKWNRMIFEIINHFEPFLGT
jgi:hypothetical protein